ncbi:MAG: fibronectin type III domain-containing protein [Myxococcota bacterium]
MRWLTGAWFVVCLVGCGQPVVDLPGPPDARSEADTTPAVDAPPAADVAPAIDTIPAVDAPPAADAVPAVDTAPGVDTAPVTDTSPPPPPLDTTPPEWPEGGALTAEDAGSQGLTLSWPSALDDSWVVAYVVSRDGAPIATVEPTFTKLTVSALDEATTYVFGVIAEDGAGNRSEVLALTLNTSDVSPPTWGQGPSLLASEVGDTQVTLSWSAAQDNVGVTGYEIHAEGAVVATTSGETTTQLTGLTPWTEATYVVVALDAVGHSAPGPSVTVKTTDSVAPSWPEGAALTTSAVTPSAVTLAWSAAEDAVGVASYQIQHEKVVVATTSGEALSVTVFGFDPSTAHTFTVWAMDAAGNLSPEGPSVTVSTLDGGAPTWPEGASLIASNLSANSVSLAWSPAIDDVGVTAYRVWQDGVPVTTVSETTAEITGLIPWTSFNFTVLAEDGAGNVSAPGPSTSISTPDTAPPTWPDGASLVASDVTPHTLTLTWAPASDDVDITSYRIRQGGADLATVGSEITSLAVTGLDPWTEVSFQVWASDPAGNESATALEVTVKTTDEVAPMWGGGALEVSNLTPTTLTLTWPTATDDVAVASVTVTMGDDTLEVLEGAATSLEVTGLSPWTEVSFGVTAADAAGNQTDTLAVSVSTPDTAKPIWPDGGALEVSSLTSTALLVSWPAAVDDVSVTHYVVTVDGGEAVTVDGGATSASLSGLHPAQTYLIALRAFDPAGNGSTELKTTITTPDGGPPTWEDAELTATAGITDVALSWTAATDDVEVTGYRVLQGGVEIAEQVERELIVSGLSPATTYTFTVEARDAAGHWSEDGPSATATTTASYDPGFRRLTQEQFNRTFSELYGYFWMNPTACNHEVAFPNGCTTTRDAAYWYDELSGNTLDWDWRDYAQYYPRDHHVAAPGEHGGGYKRLDQVVYDEHAASWLTAVMYMADAKIEGWIGYEFVLKPCRFDHFYKVTSYDDYVHAYEGCVSNFITEFGMRAFRRPLTEEEHASFMAVYNEVGEKYPEEGWSGEPTYQWAEDFAKRGLRNVIAAINLSPEFIYRVELGDDNGDLTAWELASRLSYHFWNTMPDDALFAAAADGSLLTDEGYDAQVERLFNDPKSERAMEDFYRDYFRVEEIQDISRQDGADGWGKIIYHSGPNNEEGLHPYNNPTKTRVFRIQEAMADELKNLGVWFTKTTPGTYEEMFRSNLHFLECQDIYNYDDGACWGAGPWSQTTYGIHGICEAPGDDFGDCYDILWEDSQTGWDGVSEPVTIPQPERAGLVTRMAFLAHNTLQARPIQRGLKVREMLLCDPIPPPENCDVVKPPQVDGTCTGAEGETGVSCTDDAQCNEGETCVGWDKQMTMTVREKVEELTETPGTSCAGCHSTFINGFGHALSHFSSVGKYWEKEHMFTSDKDADGNWLYDVHGPDQWAPIDASGTAILNGEMVAIDGAHELADVLVDSGQMEWCWSREYFRFAMGRIEWDADEASIEALAQTLRDGATLGDAFKAIAHLPQFKALYKPPVASDPGGEP